MVQNNIKYIILFIYSILKTSESIGQLDPTFITKLVFMKKLAYYNLIFYICRRVILFLFARLKKIVI